MKFTATQITELEGIFAECMLTNDSMRYVGDAYMQNSTLLEFVPLAHKHSPKLSFEQALVEKRLCLFTPFVPDTKKNTELCRDRLAYYHKLGMTAVTVHRVKIHYRLHDV